MLPPNPPQATPFVPPMPDTPDPSVQPEQTDAPASPYPLVLIPLSEEDAKTWKGDANRANERRKSFEAAWERNLKAYVPDTTDEKWGDEINPGVDFYQTEQKKAELFYETPQVLLTPDDDVPPQQRGPIAQWQTKLNRKLGPKDLNVLRTMDLALFSILCPSGLGCTKVGVTRVTRDVPGTDGNAVPVPVYQKLFWEHFSEKKVLIPVSWHSTEYDKSPWLGMKFATPTRLGKREYQLPDNFEGKKKTSADSEQVFNLPGLKPDNDTSEDVMTGVEIWYRASYYDDNVFHPDHMRQLVFVDGIDEPVVHRDSPYQTFDQNGVYQPDDPRNLIGNPIHLGSIRDVVDSAYVPSDSSVVRPLANELARFREQLIQQRDSSQSVRIADEKVITPDVLAKLVRSPIGAILAISEYDPNRPPMMELPKSTLPRESFESQSVIERDISKVNALGPNQTGAEQENVRSATESAFMQQGSNTRFSKERNRFLMFYTAGVAKIDALMKRFELKPGEQPISGYTYDIKPDSGQHLDATAERKFALDRYNMLRKDPLADGEYLLTELSEDLRLDPSRLVKQPPPPHPEMPKTSLIIKGEDLSPLAPQYANVIEYLAASGVQLTKQPINDQMVQNAAMQKPIKPPKGRPSPPHPGTPPEADKINEHSAALVGGGPANIGGLAGRPQ